MNKLLLFWAMSYIGLFASVQANEKADHLTSNEDGISVEYDAEKP